MDNELVERVARVLWDLSEAGHSRMQGMHSYKPVPWDSAPEPFKIAQRKDADKVLAELAGELRDARRYKRLKDGMAGGCEAEYAVTYNVGFDWYETSQSTIDALLDYKAIDEARHG